jgi:glyoxylase-like metal-dependent hydrolase (beta-lactamase superfamily II)/8-oxo-dGTP pyrophosphatase MutT (NUDIX family)
MNTSPPSGQRPPAPSATVVIVRDATAGIEVLLLRRPERGDFTSDTWVFPGGKVDHSDRQLHGHCAMLDDATASAKLGMPQGGLDYYIAAIRECFEEAGLLFAHGSAPLDIAAWRCRLQRGESLLALCQALDLRLAANQLIYFSHWLTPVGRPKRFDTRFFLAVAPAEQLVAVDGAENVEHVWITAADALAAGAALKFANPTRITLAALARFDSVRTLLQWAHEPREISMILPRLAQRANASSVVLPYESAYAEIGRLDPLGAGNACRDLQPGVPVRLSPRLIRVTANNGDVMTGPGTNSYLLGGGEQNEWAVIDPGPLDEAHVDAILAAAPGAIRWIFATHTHRDHSPAVKLLQEKTGAAVYGQLPAHPEWQDDSFKPDQILHGGERFNLPGNTTLRAIHTPGHASNHVCYLLEQEKMLFTGDHVMQASTVVINPPDGDMSAYLASLRMLLSEDIEWLAPGHGFLMAEPHRAIEWIIQHRLKREAKVVAVLKTSGPATAKELLTQVYDDVPERMHVVALRSLTAHLLKLAADGMATVHQEHWTLS